MFVSYVKYIGLKNHLCVDYEVGGKGCHDQHIEGKVEEPEVHQPEQYLDTVVMVNIYVKQTPSHELRTGLNILTECNDSRLAHVLKYLSKVALIGGITVRAMKGPNKGFKT